MPKIKPSSKIGNVKRPRDNFLGLRRLYMRPADQCVCFRLEFNCCPANLASLNCNLYKCNERVS